MSCSTSPSDESCACGTGQTRSEIACPTCRRLGMTVGVVTPQNTLKRQVRDRLDPDGHYHFCDNPDCDTVYYNEADTRVFAAADLVHKVTLKDASPDTRLCYCFKVLKREALEDIARTGTTDVFDTIQSKMKPGQSCFCEKANPRGDTCTQDIKEWLAQQGVAAGASAPAVTEPAAASGCCTSTQMAASAAGGCCGTTADPASAKSSCC